MHLLEKFWCTHWQTHLNVAILLHQHVTEANLEQEESLGRKVGKQRPIAAFQRAWQFSSLWEKAPIPPGFSLLLFSKFMRNPSGFSGHSDYAPNTNVPPNQRSPGAFRWGAMISYPTVSSPGGVGGCGYDYLTFDWVGWDDSRVI